jgi:RNAse (barnase) inhibitor barstar
MQEILLDVQPFEDKVTMHQYFQEQLGFSSYYGANLEALFDELASATEALSILLRYPTQPRGKMAEYLPRLLIVFEDAARENYNLSIRFEATGR